MIEHIDRNKRTVKGNMVQVASLNETIELYKWLQGEKMEGYKIKYQPKLNKEQAFAIIYLLQEAYGFIPDVYEKCDTCGKLYDSDVEGDVISDEEQSKYINCCAECMQEKI